MTQQPDPVAQPAVFVLFGATGDLAKLETFPALVGLVKRGVLNVPVIGVAKSGWALEQFRDYATASLKLNGMDAADPAAVKMLSLLRYVDGRQDGAISQDGLVMGAYAHGLFAADSQRAAWLATLGVGSDLAYDATVERTLDELAAHIVEHVDLDRLIKLARY